MMLKVDERNGDDPGSFGGHSLSESPFAEGHSFLNII